MTRLSLSLAVLVAAGCAYDAPTIFLSNSSTTTRNASGASSTWHPVDLGIDTAATGTGAWAVSRQLNIAGLSNFPTQPSPFTFVKRAGGGYRYLTPLPGHTIASPTGINDAGLISGRSYLNAVSLPTPVFWDSEGRAGAIPGLVNGEAFDVSETAWIVGYAILFTGIRGFRWRPGTAATLLLGEFPSSLTRAVAINDAGIAVGDDGRPALWDHSGVMHRLPAPAGARFGTATDINNAGEVVGEFRFASGVTRAFRWTASQGLTLLPNPPGTTSSYATHIDERGRVFGFAAGTSAPTLPKAYVWVDGSPIPLPQLYPDAYFRDVSACGVAVGHGTAADGKLHAIVWLTEC